MFVCFLSWDYWPIFSFSIGLFLKLWCLYKEEILLNCLWMLVSLVSPFRSFEWPNMNLPSSFLSFGTDLIARRRNNMDRDKNTVYATRASWYYIIQWKNVFQIVKVSIKQTYHPLPHNPVLGQIQPQRGQDIKCDFCRWVQTEERKQQGGELCMPSLSFQIAESISLFPQEGPNRGRRRSQRSS